MQERKQQKRNEFFVFCFCFVLFFCFRLFISRVPLQIPTYTSGGLVLLHGIKVVSKRFATAKGIYSTKPQREEQEEGCIGQEGNIGSRRWILDVDEYAIMFPGSVLDDSERAERMPTPPVFTSRTLCPDCNLQLCLSSINHHVSPLHQRNGSLLRSRISMQPGLGRGTF